MLLTYSECIDKYGSDYRLKKEILSGNIFMKEKGIYSTRRNISDIEVIMSKYPKAVFTDKSAYYYHSLTDVIPDYFHLATKREDSRIRDSRVKQSFLKDEIFDGEIWAMAIPQEFVFLAGEIKAWQDKYGGIDSEAMSPFQSESFGGYSYSKGGSSVSNRASSVTTWSNTFASRLNKWRKIR